MRRRIVAVLSSLLIAGLLSPVVTGRDGFPVSTYPMFSRPLPAEAAVSSVISRDRAGTETRLPPEIVGGTTEVVHAARTISQAVRRGDTAGLCAEIAERVRSGEDAAVVVEIRRDTYDVVGWFDGLREPLSRSVLATCPVERRSPQ